MLLVESAAAVLRGVVMLNLCKYLEALVSPFPSLSRNSPPVV